ncbi:heavy metal translocating P-type ATPase [Desulfarculus baarsii]
MPSAKNLGRGPSVAHEANGRIRLRGRLFADPALDHAYVEAMIMALPGVIEARLNAGAACLVARHDGRPGVREAILAALGDLPDEAFLPGRRRKREGLDKAAALGLLALGAKRLPRPLGGLLSWLAAAPVIAGGLETLINRGLKVEVLDAAAVSALLLRGDYRAAGAIVALLALGRHLEQTSEEKSSALLKSLLAVGDEDVSVERDGAEIRQPAAKLAIGDIVVCGPGDKIVVDGQVTWGQAELNQSSITGEARTVAVEVGDRVISGATVQEGKIKIRAQQVGRHTAMARVGSFIETAVRHQSEPEKRSARLADRLTPVSLGLAGGLLLLTGDPRRAVSVLTVDFGCALKLAAPLAVKTAMYNAGRRGVLIKGARALEALSRVDAVVFDKTGTITHGDLEVTDVVPLDGMSAEELLALAAGAEEHYSHPVGRAVVRAARRRGLPQPALSQVDFIVAHGVSAYVADQRVLVGSLHFLAEDEGVDCSAAEGLCASLRDQGKSILYVGHENHLEGVIALRDRLRPEAGAVLAGLRAAGVEELVVLTGDHRQTAQALARDLPQLDAVRWELRPEDKAAIVAELQARGRVVAFVGDGVNDAPALVTADVGVCMPAGAELARDAAQVVLLQDDLWGLLSARQLAARFQATVGQSFFAAIGLNCAIMLAAAAGRLSPLGAALLHNLSTIGILGHAAAANLRPAETGPRALPQERVS